MLQVYSIKYLLIDELDPELGNLLLSLIRKNFLSFNRWVFVVTKRDLELLRKLTISNSEQSLLNKLEKWVTRFGEGEFCIIPIVTYE